MTLKSSKGSPLAMACYEVTMSGADDECGDVETCGHAALIRGPLKLTGAFLDLTPENMADLSNDDLRILSQMAGAIVYTDSQGFVDVDTFDRAEDLEARWEECQEEAGQSYVDD